MINKICSGFSNLLIVFAMTNSQVSLAAGVATGSAEKNLLYQHPSAYLAMHGKDPVRWQEWGEQAVEQARKQDKLLFVSSGYFSCHWCHVMQRESYQNQEVAKLLNTHFIPVKVDRELNSALDAHLIDFVERTQGQSGWPLNTFVTPDGYPLVGFTYAPAENFIQILTNLAKEWQQNKSELKKLASGASIELSTAEVSSSTKLPADLAVGMIDLFVGQNFTYADELQGGYGQENKFPSVPKLEALLTIYERKPEPQIKQFLNLTLRNMATEGLWDQLGGGFYRYVVDPGWQVPHFEKMLYDNALLASLYYRAARILKEPDYQQIADQTLDFILTDLDTTSAAYAASLSAVDGQGVEGGYYLWDKDQLKAILSAKELPVVSLFWGLEGPPDLDHGHHLVQTRSTQEIANRLNLSVSEVDKLLGTAREKMLKQRTRRILPKDGKILTAWNGLTLSALVAGARHSGEQRYQVAAADLVQYIREKLWDQGSRTLYKARGEGGSLGEGGLEDYAYVAEGLYAWWQLTKDSRDKRLLEQILEQGWQRFYSKQGWQLAENMLLKYRAGQTMVSDGPLPSPSAVIIETSYRFAEQTNSQQLKDRARRALNVGYKQLESESFWFATQIKAILAVQ
jgi:hypothetical protein